jgi:hypothetical protein
MLSSITSGIRGQIKKWETAMPIQAQNTMGRMTFGRRLQQRFPCLLLLGGDLVGSVGSSCTRLDGLGNTASSVFFRFGLDGGTDVVDFGLFGGGGGDSGDDAAGDITIVGSESTCGDSGAGTTDVTISDPELIGGGDDGRAADPAPRINDSSSCIGTSDDPTIVGPKPVDGCDDGGANDIVLVVSGVDAR